MKKLIGFLAIFVAQGALAGTCLIKTTETYIYTGERVLFSQISVPSLGVQDCARKGQETANFVFSSNIQNSVEVLTTAQFLYNNGGASQRMQFVGQYFQLTPQWEVMYPHLLLGPAYLGLYASYHYRYYGHYPVGPRYNHPEVRIHFQTRQTREVRIVEHRTVYERSRGRGNGHGPRR